MYAGEIVEMGSAETIFRSPAHAYTRGLIGAIPTLKTIRTQPLAVVEKQARPVAALSLREVAPGHWARISI